MTEQDIRTLRVLRRHVTGVVVSCAIALLAALALLLLVTLPR